MFRSGQCFKLPQDFLAKHNLEYEFVELEHIRQLLEFQDQTLLKLSPYLKENCLDPSHFEVQFLFFFKSKPEIFPQNIFLQITSFHKLN